MTAEYAIPWPLIDDFGRDVLNRTPRTMARYRAKGMPVIKFGKEVRVDPPKIFKWFEDGMPGPQGPAGRRNRRVAA